MLATGSTSYKPRKYEKGISFPRPQFITSKDFQPQIKTIVVHPQLLKSTVDMKPGDINDQLDIY